MTARRRPGGFVVRRQAEGRSPEQREFMRRFRENRPLGSLLSFAVLLLVLLGHETEPVGGPGWRGPHEQTSDQDRHGPGPDLARRPRERPRDPATDGAGPVAGAAIVISPKRRCPAAPRPRSRTGTRSIGTRSSDELRATADLARELGLWVVVGCAPPAHAAAPAPQQPLRHLRPGRARHAVRQAVPLPHRDHRLAHAGPGALRLRGGRLAVRLRPLHRGPLPRAVPRNTRSWASIASCSRPTPTTRCSASRPRATPRRTATGSACRSRRRCPAGSASRLIAPTGEVQAAATPSVSGLAVDLLDEDCPRWEIALHREALAGQGPGRVDLPAPLRPGPAKRPEDRVLIREG